MFIIGEIQIFGPRSGGCNPNPPRACDDVGSHFMLAVPNRDRGCGVEKLRVGLRYSRSISWVSFVDWSCVMERGAAAKELARLVLDRLEASGPAYLFNSRSHMLFCASKDTKSRFPPNFSLKSSSQPVTMLHRASRKKHCRPAI